MFTSKKLTIIVVCLALILILRFLFSYHFRHTYHDGEQVRWSILLLSDIDGSSKNSTFTTLLPGSFPPQRVTIQVPASDQVHFGQTISIFGNLSRKLLKNNNVVNTIYLPKITINQSITNYPLLFLYYLREKIIATFKMTLSDIDSSLLLGIVFGIKATMPKTFSQALQATGVTHVIAASGMNVTMVAGFLIWVFGKYVPRRLAIIISIVGVLSYAVFAGLQASILRASIMGISVFSAQLFGRQSHSLYMVSLTAFIMLMFSPYLLFDVGFQLSFLSTLGIITMQPLLHHHNLISDDIATTIAAQIATIPILLVTFGQYSLLSVLVNALVLWTIPPLMILGSSAAGFGLLIPFVGKVFLYLTLPLLWYFEQVITFFSSMPGVVHVSLASPLIVIGYYLIVIALVYFFKYQPTRNKNKLNP